MPLGLEEREIALAELRGGAHASDCTSRTFGATEGYGPPSPARGIGGVAGHRAGVALPRGPLPLIAAQSGPELFLDADRLAEVSIYERIKRWRARRKAALLDEYATLSPEERAEIDQLREQQNAARGITYGAPKISDREFMSPDR
jgi:hypothetical protein